MADYIETTLTSLETLLLATLPGVTTGGIWEGEQSANIPWEDFTLPFIAIVMGDMNEDVEGDWGVTNQVYVPDVEIYYAEETKGGNAGLRTAAVAVRDALEASSLATLQVLGVTGISYARSLEPNLIFTDKRTRARAVRLIARLMMGQTRV